MDRLLPLVFEEELVRIIMIDGDPWFVGKDVCRRLGYADPTNAMKQHCKGVVKRHPIVDALGRTQQVRILSEADVLRLIVSSHMPAAQRFERWLFEELLPSIRRTGTYTLPGQEPPAPQLPAASHLRATRELERKTRNLLRSSNPAEQRLLYTSMVELAAGLGRDLEPIEQFVPQHAHALDVARFWDALFLWLRDGVIVNHYRTLPREQGGIALRWRDVQRLCRNSGFNFDVYAPPFKAALAVHPSPRFIGIRAVNCPDDHVRSCWVFSHLPACEAALTA